MNSSKTGSNLAGFRASNCLAIRPLPGRRHFT